MSEMEVIPLTGNIGARLERIQVNQPLPDETIAELRRVLLQYKVIFLHDEGLTYDTQVAFARRFGEVIHHPLYWGPADKPLLQPMDSVAGARADHWHTDLTFVRQPSAFAFLRGVVIPPVGGDTIVGQYRRCVRQPPRRIARSRRSAAHRAQH